MTMTAPAPRPVRNAWTTADLEQIPDDGYRYEIAHGSLLVTPPPALKHVGSADHLCQVLKQQAPPDIFVTAVGAGVNFKNLPGDTTFYIPDIVAFPIALLKGDRKLLAPGDVKLAIEVLSPGNKANDLVLKRHDYAASGIPQYWIVDPQAQTLTVLENDGKQNYRELATVKAGESWESESPFPLRVDPGDFT